jgi:hypothetical protein
MSVLPSRSQIYSSVNGTGPTIGDVRSHGEFEGKSRLVEGAGETVLMTHSDPWLGPYDAAMQPRPRNQMRYVSDSETLIFDQRGFLVNAALFAWSLAGRLNGLPVARP